MFITEFHEANRDNELFASTEDPEFEFDESGLQLASKEGIVHFFTLFYPMLLKLHFNLLFLCNVELRSY